MNKANIVYPLNGGLFDHKKELSTDKWYTTDRNLLNIMLCVKSQSQKITYMSFHLYVKNRQIYRDRK